MRKIPPELRAKLDADPWMHRCCITGRTDEKIEWHHNLIFAGRQVNEDWAILPLLESVHDDIPGAPALRELCDWIMLNRASEDQLRPYCKSTNYLALKARLNRKYGPYYVSTYPGLTAAHGAVRFT